MTSDAPTRIYELDHYGVPFSRTADGRIAQRPFGGAGYPRTCYAADKTGLYILHTLNEQAVKHGIKVYNEWAALSLAIDDGLCHGLVALNMQTGEMAGLRRRCRGHRHRRRGTHLPAKQPTPCSPRAIAWPWPTGRAFPLKDAEFVQFHPTTLAGTNILMSEAARGEGGYLVNNLGERFMAKYAPKAMELAPRDIVSRSIQTEIDEGRGFPGGTVHLDLRHLGREKILERLPGIRDLAISFSGVDCLDNPVPIQPGAALLHGRHRHRQGRRHHREGPLRRRRVRLRQRPRRQPPGRQQPAGVRGHGPARRRGRRACTSRARRRPSRTPRSPTALKTTEAERGGPASSRTARSAW